MPFYCHFFFILKFKIFFSYLLLKDTDMGIHFLEEDFMEAILMDLVMVMDMDIHIFMVNNNWIVEIFSFFSISMIHTNQSIDNIEGSFIFYFLHNHKK